MEEIFYTKVTKINDRWHARLLQLADDELFDEMACDNKENIGYICCTMLRWADKMGWSSPMAHAARERQKSKPAPGKIWYHKHLLHEQRINK